ncbi:hypothetical protein ABZX85_12605 [Streptomyces sp. NPDC004539]|uniref:phosphotransferase-like protein n=1 Tax=Streptomyces sp. NPDC004539 TaxID=3154280 RepID=UPI0033A7CE5F
MTSVSASQPSGGLVIFLNGTSSSGKSSIAESLLTVRLPGWRLVGVHCALPELERRERERGDRTPGLAARQLAQVHAHGLYDVECDTSVDGPAECARRIKDFLPRRSTPTAFERLRTSLPAERTPAG